MSSPGGTVKCAHLSPSTSSSDNLGGWQQTGFQAGQTLGELHQVNPPGRICRVTFWGFVSLESVPSSALSTD
jgi:hypothetical protein